jgi:hypothetical protein
MSMKLNTSVMTLGTWSILSLAAFLWVLVPGRQALPAVAWPIDVISALILIFLAARSVKAAWAGSVPGKDLLLPFKWRLVVVVARVFLVLSFVGMLTGFVLDIGGPVLPTGQAEMRGGSYYANNHGTLTAASEDVYWRKIRQEERWFFGASLAGCLTALLVVGEAGERAQAALPEPDSIA